jgi:hypothetical protein
VVEAEIANRLPPNVEPESYKNHCRFSPINKEWLAAMAMTSAVLHSTTSLLHDLYTNPCWEPGAVRWGNGIVVCRDRPVYEQALFISQQQQLKDGMQNSSSKRKEAAAKHRSTTGTLLFL